jgi:hypothetical protein
LGLTLAQHYSGLGGQPSGQVGLLCLLSNAFVVLTDQDGEIWWAGTCRYSYAVRSRTAYTVLQLSGRHALILMLWGAWSVGGADVIRLCAAVHCRENDPEDWQYGNPW